MADVTTKEPLPSNWALIWNRASLHIPPLPPEIHNCSIVSVDYGLIFEIAKITLTLEVSLGSVPLRHTFARLRSQYQMDWNLVDPADPDQFPIALLPLPPVFDNYPGMRKCFLKSLSDTLREQWNIWRCPFRKKRDK